jgi:hypothetical protein
MAVPEFNHTIIRNKQYVFNIAVTTDGTATNLTSGTLRMTAKYSYADADANAVFIKLAANGLVITNAAGGLATITIAPSDTSNLAEHRIDLVYDIQLTDSTPAVWCLVRGKITVLPDVSTITP